ncbi:MAG: hypothetical protein ABSC04_14005 [Syntrophobacteraceae bacterium]|jgi:restriction system protein
MDDLALLPWWVNVIFAVIVYLCLKYWIPTIKFQNSFDAGTANAARALAPFLSAVILATAAVSAFNSRSKRRFPEKQKGAGSRRSIPWREFEKLVGEAYRKEGCRVTATGAAGADG